MMAFSRQQEQKRVELAMGSIIKEALKLLRASLPATIRIDARIAAEGLVFADPTQIHQVMMNLATNAAQALQGAKGTIEVTLKPVTFDPGDTIPHPDLKPGTVYTSCLTVRDTGQGIDPKHLPRIFDPLFHPRRRSARERGWASRWSTASSRVTTAFVVVESRLGEGTCFSIYIPAVAGRPLPKQGEDVPDPRRQGADPVRR